MRGSHVKSDNTHSHQHTPLSPYAWHLRLDFQLRSSYSLSQPHRVTASHPSPGDNHHSTLGQFKRTRGQAKMAAWNSFSYICIRAHHSIRSFAHWLHSWHSNQTSQTLHLKNIQFPSLIPHASALYSAIDTTTPSHRHFLAFSPSPLLLSTLFSAVHALYHSFILCTTSVSHPLMVRSLVSPYHTSSTS